ncbi:pyrimidine 5'-nucleotidase [Litorisediminicola beolgyonensis]|uniref:Pyrimidine 5'-nucleotidase n=1 Tax=Litorisediminicola beolgyonensis TaxID=1173614 RepID=A0ABW3ZGH3_9RHOB
MMKPLFSHIEHWVFDLDNTLYPPAMRLFDQIERKMAGFVMRTLRVEEAEANRLRDHWWRTHGTTLAGLMRDHEIDPEAYLHEVHDISFDALEPDPYLAGLIADLPGRKIVYTNGSAPYAARVLEARGLAQAFDAIYGVEHADYAPKPEARAFETVFGKAGTVTARAAMFEDDARNLAAPHAMGMRTVHVAPEPEDHPHIHHHTDDLAAFLARLV